MNKENASFKYQNMGEETKTVTKDTLEAIFKSDEQWKAYPIEKRIPILKSY